MPDTNGKNKKYNLIIGRHVSNSKLSGFLPGAAREALSLGANSFMVYLGSPRRVAKRPSLAELKVPEFKKVLTENKVDINNVIVHAPYAMNLANTLDKKTFDNAVGLLKEEMNRMEKIGLKTIVVHPGSALSVEVKKVKEGLSQVAKGLNLVLEENSTVRIALETMCNRGGEVGGTFEHLKYIVDKVKQKERVGVCWDTCHLYTAGYDIKNNLEAVIKEFDQKVGLDKLWVIHVNDSLQGLGTKIDRHENIGFGNIGYKTLKKVVWHPKFNGIPKLLETPQKKDKESGKDFSKEIKELSKKD